MTAFLFAASILIGLVGMAIIHFARTSVGEIQGLSVLIIAAVLFCGGAIVDAIGSAIRRFERMQKPAPPPTPAITPSAPLNDAWLRELRMPSLTVWAYIGIGIILIWLLGAAIYSMRG